MRFKVLVTWSLTAILGFGMQSCSDNDPIQVTPEYPVPETYAFENVDYSGQTDRLNQLEEMTNYMKTANTSGVRLDEQVLLDMFENTNGDANGAFSFESSKQLKDKCFGPHVANIESYIRDLVRASESTVPAANGQAGVMVSEDGSKSYLFDENGVEHIQYIEKELMGAVLYYQATAVYMGTEKMDVDNEEVVPGQGTAMEHHWDEAYGYVGIPNDFPNNTTDVRFWGKYCVGRDALLGTNESLSYALRKGRTGITVKEYEMRDEAIAEARAAWEDVCAGTAIHYINDALNNLGDDLVRNHVLSEAKAFVTNLVFNPEKRIEQGEIDQVIALLGTNFYEVSSDDLQAARDLLAEIYEMEDVKSQL
jgi:hypothetical protein